MAEGDSTQTGLGSVVLYEFQSTITCVKVWASHLTLLLLSAEGNSTLK